MPTFSCVWRPTIIRTNGHFWCPTNIRISLWAGVVAEILATTRGYNRFNIRTIPTVAYTVCIEKPTSFSKERERERERGKFEKGGKQKDTARETHLGRNKYEY